MTTLLTAQDLAAWLRLPKSSVYELCRRELDPLPALRLGKHLRFRPEDVNDWLERQRNGVSS